MDEHDLDRIDSRPYPDGHGGRIYIGFCTCGFISDQTWRWPQAGADIEDHIVQYRPNAVRMAGDLRGSVQTQRNSEGDTDGDDDSREEDSSGDTEDGVKHG